MSDPSAVPTESSSRATLQTAAVGLGALTAALVQTLVLPVLPTIAADIGASASQSSWLLTSTLLVAAVSVPIISRIADVLGRRLMLQIALGALVAGSIVDGLTSNITVMIAGRALQGLSAAAIPLGISLLAATLPPQRQVSGTSMISGMLGIGSALGLPLAGLVGENADYHVLYWIGAAGAAASLALITMVVREAPRTNGTGGGDVDVVGIVLFAAGLTCLVLPLAQGSQWGWSSARILGLLAGSLVLLGTLVVVELRTRSPLVDMRALSRPPIALTNIASVFIGFALFASFVGTSTYVQAPTATGYGFDASILTAGLAMLPSGVLMFFLSPMATRLIRSWGAARVLALSGAVIAAGMVMRILVIATLFEVIVGAAVVGVGTRIGYAAMPTLINEHTPARDLAAANGVNTLARSLGNSLASAVGGSILAAVTLDLNGHPVTSLTGYRVLFAISAAAALIAAFFGLTIHRMRTDATASPTPAPTPVRAGAR